MCSVVSCAGMKLIIVGRGGIMCTLPSPSSFSRWANVVLHVTNLRNKQGSTVLAVDALYCLVRLLW